MLGRADLIEKGHKSVTDTMRWVGSRLTGADAVDVEHSVLAPSGDLAYTVGFERSHVSVDELQRQATVRGTAVALTPTEWGVLTALATVPGRVYSRFELINRVRGYEFDGYERTVDSHVKNLRRKIEKDPANPRIVQTVLGGGYRLGLPRDD